MQETTWLKDKRTLDGLVRNYTDTISYISNISCTDKKGADELKKSSKYAQSYYNIAERWEKSAEKMQSLEKGISYSHNLEAIISNKVTEETRKLTRTFKKSYKELKDISRTNDIPLIKEKRNALDSLCYCYNTITKEISLRATGRKPTSRTIDKYIGCMEKVKDISNKFARVKDVYKRNNWLQENIINLKKLLKGSLLKRIFRMDDFSLYCVIKDYKKTRYYEGVIEANEIKKDILDCIKNCYSTKTYDVVSSIKMPVTRFVYEPIRKKEASPEKIVYTTKNEEAPAKQLNIVKPVLQNTPSNGDYYELRELVSGRRNKGDLTANLKAINTKIQSVAYAANKEELKCIKGLYANISDKLGFGYIAEKINSCHEHVLLKNSLLDNFKRYIQVSEQRVCS